MKALKWVLTLPWRIVRFPFRLYRRKISVQLIFSHIMVVMLSILLLEAAIIAVAAAIFAQVEDEAFTEYSMAQFAASAAIVLSDDPALRGLDTDDATLNAADQQRLAARLTALASEELPSNINIEVGVNTDPPETSIGLIDRAMITNRDGVILASSDDLWAPPGTSIHDLEFPLLGRVAQRVVDRDGRTDGNSHRYAIEAVNRITVASYPLLVDGQMVGVLTLHSEPIQLPNFADFAAGVAVANAVILVAIGLPALLVSIPVGIWRARRLSKRLGDLADAATAMGQGDLSRRIRVRGHDEVAHVSLRFNDMVDRLERTDQARKAFVANVSHELRTPVAIIQGNLERMIADADANGLSEDKHRTLDTLHRETLTLSRLIDDLFTMARIEETSLPLNMSSINLPELAADVVNGVRDVAWEQRKVSVESLVPADLPPVAADRTRLRQILGNLLYNALRHTPEGGLIVVNAESNGTMAQISVSDTGVGISAEELERVFDRFYQIERTGRNAEGSGLGLSIVKQLVEAQGGTVSVESIAGQGTTFRFTLPIAS